MKRPLTVEQILAWADAHHQRTGRWPSTESGNVQDAPGERWCNLDDSLRLGLRSLPGGDSLGRLLDRHRDRDQTLTVRQILAWPTPPDPISGGAGCGQFDRSFPTPPSVGLWAMLSASWVLDDGR
jgi:hypothetical protein